MAQTSLSTDSKINSLLSGYQWGSNNGTAVSLSYSFPLSGSQWPTNYGNNEPFSPNSFTPLTTTQQQNFRDALALWAEVANISLTEVSDSVPGDIRPAFSSLVTGNTGGYAYLPTSTTAAESGDVWLNTKTSHFNIGQRGFTTMIHEIGHALGLKHPFETSSQNTTVLPTSENTTQYTLMSYNRYNGAGYFEESPGAFFPIPATTPMLYDIAAIQFLYGANTQTRSADDQYTFSRDQAELKTIWDGGGQDTFNLSNQTQNATVNLTAGSFSSIGTVNYKLVGNFIQSTSEPAVDNIAIAYGVNIENVIGGSGNDTLTGNNLDNQLTGGQGNDILNGGKGNDTALYNGNQADYSLSHNGNSTIVTSLSGTEGTDTLTAIEKIQFKDVLIDTSTLQPVTNPTSIPTTAAEVVTNPTEGLSNHINYFLLQISTPLSNDASVFYQTRDGSAIAGSDYIATSGTATIAAGKTSVAIAITLIGDSIAEANESFSLVVSNPVGASFPTGIREISATHTIIDDDTIIAANQMDELVLLGQSSIPSTTVYG